MVDTDQVGDGSAIEPNEYTASAEFLHVLSTAMWPEVRPRLAAALAGVDGAAGPVVEFGAGTGLGTDVVLDTVDAEVLATEPSAELRAVLLARMADRADAHRVTVIAGGAEQVALPAQLAGAVGMHMIGHLHPEARRDLWARLAPRLAQGAPLVVNALEPHTAVAVPTTPPFGVLVGRLSYQGQGQAEPTGPESLRWSMTYRVFEGEALLREATAQYDWWVLSPEQLAAELAAAGLQPKIDGHLVRARAPQRP